MSSAFEAEALRVHQRFVVEVIEQNGLCPWAEGTRTSGALERAVMLDEDPERAADAIVAFGESVLVGILIWPRFLSGPELFEELLGRVRRAEEARRGKRSPFVTALFHPRLAYSDGSAEQLVPLFRRSPDPSVQLIRHAALEAVRSAAPSGKFVFDWSARAWAELERREQQLPVSDRIARDNQARLGQLGIDRLLALYQDIRADRDRAYAQLGEK